MDRNPHCLTSRDGRNYHPYEVGTVALLFESGEHNCIAVKVADDRDVESLRILHLSKGVKWTLRRFECVTDH
jgi:hypothetical protein